MIKNGDTLITSRLNKKFTQDQLDKKFDQLYNEESKRKAKKQKMREQRDMTRSLEDMRQCTFKPSVNPQTTLTGSNPGSFIKRQMDWLNKKDKKIQQLSRQTQKKLKKQCSFRPTISKKTYNLLHNPKRSQFLHQTSQNTTLSRRSQNSSSYRQIHMKKQTLKQIERTNSSLYTFNLLTQKRGQLKLQTLRGFLDPNDRTIWKNNISTPNVTPCHSLKKICMNQNIGSLSNNYYQDSYIENIAEQQDTFNSSDSLEMKTQTKQTHQVSPYKTQGVNLQRESQGLNCQLQQNQEYQQISQKYIDEEEEDEPGSHNN